MKPSELRDYNNKCLVCQFLWRLMPRAMKELYEDVKNQRRRYKNKKKDTNIMLC